MSRSSCADGWCRALVERPEDNERADGLNPPMWRGPSGCTRRSRGGGVFSRPGAGSLGGSMSGQSGLVREDGTALAAFRRCTVEVCPEHAAVHSEVLPPLPLWIGHGRSGKPASVPAESSERRLHAEGAASCARSVGPAGTRPEREWPCGPAKGQSSRAALLGVPSNTQRP